MYHTDDIIHGDKKLIVISKEGFDYPAKFIIKEGKTVFYEYHQNIVEELKEKYLECVFLVSPTYYSS